MNAITSIQVSRLQSAIPAAILNANKVPVTLKVKPAQMLNLRRRIYDTMLEAEDSVFPSEMKDHLQIFGYSPQGVETEMREMFKARMLTRTKLRPYAYKLARNCPVPSDELIKVRNYTKPTPVVASPVVDNNKALPSMAKLNSHIEILANLAKSNCIQYGNLSADMDLVTNHFSKLRSDCTRVANVDPDVAEQYGLVGNDLDYMIDHLKDLEKSILQIAQLAKVIRSNPL